MRKKARNEKRGWIAIPIVIGIGVLVYWRADKADKKDLSLRQHMKVTSATILTCEDQERGNVHFTYEYRVNGNRYEAADRTPQLRQGHESDLVNKKIPVVYDSTDPGNSYLLITPGSYSRFNLKFPDSMAWEKPYLISEE